MSMTKMFSLSIVLAFCCLALLSPGRGREDADRAAERRRSQKIREFGSKYRPREIPSEIERRSLVEIYGTVASAYGNGQVSVIHQCETLISNRVANLDYFEYEALSKGLIIQLNKNFFELRKIEEFTSQKELSDYLEVNLALVRFLGMAAAERLERENYVNGWEGLSLRNLKDYKKRAMALGLREHERVVDEFLARWIDLVESEKGLTRIKLHRFMPAMLMRAQEVGDVSPDQVIKGVRTHALCLINCGYKPKWLDEEFPLPVETDGADGNLQGGGSAEY